jgi:hypothetical protein
MYGNILYLLSAYRTAMTLFKSRRKKQLSCIKEYVFLDQVHEVNEQSM